MVRRAFTAVIERNSTFVDAFETEPYESGWASEARWFVRVLSLQGEDVKLTIDPELSPDGLFWCAEGRPPLVIREPGLYSFPLRDFGHWLRLRGHLTGQAPAARLLIYLALKE